MTTKIGMQPLVWSPTEMLPKTDKIFAGGETMSIVVEVKLVDGTIQRAHTWRMNGEIEVAWILDDDEPIDLTSHVLMWRHCSEVQAA